ncbi:hypothetical protein A1O3_00198 [Capronia epimyces CBS 606.96]|uniref:Polycomb protein VEFS-Box domain-containing protein n=1 Tax=Capronia epimyces CBS 606.96 TaxID=1182542 RepID=W9YGG7_9EURO|nr:uncharacterized protein A1O3_00198 [Capronia epimyces CBS 606.96]EXJ91648.1 hypothetical protein A1O3_00198 [Capronia epimyces CBS 606.96]
MLNIDSDVNASHSERNFSRHFVEEVTFAREIARTRHKLFLPRNLARVLAHHQRVCEAKLTSTDASTSPAAKFKLCNFVDELVGETIPSAAGAGAAGHLVEGSPTLQVPLARSSEAHSNPPEMASSSRSPALYPEGVERSSRRSIRGLLERVYERPEAELLLDFDSIRKKLNFKTNHPDENERPAKRQKRDVVKCQCHLTIWDNRAGHEVVLTTKSTYCRLTTTETALNGYFVDIELDKSFVIQADDLKVSVPTKDGSILGFTDKYFLEIKIIPCRNGSLWPPIPLLGKSDGDHFARDARKTGPEDLQGAVVARYTHLPQAPDPDVPLSVFFLHEGRTYRTKYGLQVLSAWQRSTEPNKTLKPRNNGFDPDSFRSPTPNGAPNGVEPTPAIDNDSTAAIVNQTHHQPQICYHFSIELAAQIAPKPRIMTVSGYQCTMCTWKTSKLQNLQFHLTTMHSKLSFTVQRPRRDHVSNELSHIQINVNWATPPEKQGGDTKAIAWQAPAHPCDRTDCLEGHHSCASEENDTRSAVAKPPAPPLASVKKSTSGFLPAEDVPDFREPERNRYRAIRLESKYEEAVPVYTSVSHRPVSPSEDPRSETDDEIDSVWQIDLHMERLDLAAKREGWSDYERELRKRWDKHRMEEQLEHSRYLSNSLIRFVRKHRSWIRKGDDELLVVFFEFLEDLKDSGVIDDDVVSDVNELVFQFQESPGASPAVDPPSRTSSAMESFTMTTRGRHRREVESQAPRNARPQSEPASNHTPRSGQSSAAIKNRDFICGHCAKLIIKPMQNTVLCADPECQTPTVMFHRKCARLHLGFDVFRGQSLEQIKGKKPMVAMGPTASPNTPSGKSKPKLDFPVNTWRCPNCAKKQKAVAREDLVVSPAMRSRDRGTAK